MTVWCAGLKTNDKEVKKILKYKDLSIAIENMWNAKAKAIPAVPGTTEIISKSPKKYLSNIPGKH